MEINEQLEQIIKGSIIGYMVGDALATNSNELKYSASSASMLCMIASINEFGRLEMPDVMDRIYNLFIGGYLMPSENDDVRLTNSTVVAINNFSNGMPLDKCGDKNETDAGALLRLLPVALFFATDPDEFFIETCHNASCVTHPHIDSQTACAVYGLLVRNLLMQRAEKVFDLLEDYYKTTHKKEHLDSLMKLKQQGSHQIRDPFWSTWNCYGSYDFDCGLCIEKASAIGNNSIYVAPLVGSLAVLSNGLNDLPAHWLRKLSLTSEAMDIIMTFVDTVVEKTVRELHDA